MNIYRNLDSGITGVLIKTGQTSLRGYYLANNAATARFVKLYNKATAPASTDTPLVTMILPATSAANIVFGSEAGVDAFTLGLGIRSTTGIADADVGAPTANDVVVNIYYN